MVGRAEPVDHREGQPGQGSQPEDEDQEAGEQHGFKTADLKNADLTENAKQKGCRFPSHKPSNNQQRIQDVCLPADRIRNEVGLPTMVGGYLTTSNEVNTVLAAGRADLCILSR